MAHQIVEGRLDARGMKFAVIVARFNSVVSDRLLEGALNALMRTGAAEGDIEVVRVPGSWELPVVAVELARQKRHDAIVCLGAVIRGETPHFDHVAAQAASGIARAATDTGVPVVFGVLTANTIEQATDRAGGKSGNKGFEAAMTAVEMGSLMRQLRARP